MNIPKRFKNLHEAVKLYIESMINGSTYDLNSRSTINFSIAYEQLEQEYQKLEQEYQNLKSPWKTIDKEIPLKSDNYFCKRKVNTMAMGTVTIDEVCYFSTDHNAFFEKSWYGSIVTVTAWMEIPVFK